MNKRTFSVYLLLSYCAFQPLFGDKPSDWKTFGKKWSTGKKKIYKQKLSNSATFYGEVELSEVTIEKNITCYGATEITQSTCAGVATLYGSLLAQGCTFKDIDIRCAQEQGAEGIAHVKSSSINKLFIQGKLVTDDTTIKEITSFSQELTLNNSRVHTLLIMGSNEDQQKSVVLNNTLVEGDIIFAQKGGTVVYKGTSAIKGRLVGGKIQK